MDRMKAKRLAEIEQDDLLMASGGIELLQALKAEREAYREVCEEIDDAEAEHPIHLKKRIKELEERLKQSQEWRNYYRARWMNESIDGVIPPMTDIQLEAILGHADVFAALKDSEVSDK